MLEPRYRVLSPRGYAFAAAAGCALAAVVALVMAKTGLWHDGFAPLAHRIGAVLMFVLCGIAAVGLALRMQWGWFMGFAACWAIGSAGASYMVAGVPVLGLLAIAGAGATWMSTVRASPYFPGVSHMPFVEHGTTERWLHEARHDGLKSGFGAPLESTAW